MLLKRWQTMDTMHEELNRFEEEMSRLLGWKPVGGLRSSSSTFPSVNMWQDEDYVFVDVELPGMGQEEVEVLVTPENQLLVSGERLGPVDEDGRWHRRERRFGKFQRQFSLPVEVDPEQVTAQLKAGVLRIQLTEKESVKPRKIEIRNGSQS